MYRTLAGLLAAVVGALSLAGLTFSASVGAPADVRILNGIEPETLDPQQLTGVNGGRIVSALFEGLTRYEARSLAAAPGVAESWELSDDGRQYTFRLREAARWSDGEPIAPADFVYSFRRMLAPETGAEYAYLLHPVRGARAIHTFDGLADAIDTTIRPALALELGRGAASLTAEGFVELAAGVSLHTTLQHCPDPLVRELLDGTPQPLARERLEAFAGALPRESARLREAARDARARFGETLGVYPTGERTLVIELEAPTPYFLDLTSFYPLFPVPERALAQHGESWFLPEHIVSNGPFLLESWRVNDRIRLRKNPRYWGKDEVRAEVIELFPVENVTTSLNLYLTREADWLPTAYPTDLVQELRVRPDFYEHPGFGVYFYRLNTRRPPLDDRRVREALNLAVDRELITRRLLGLGQRPATTFVPPGLPGYEPPASGIRLDVERAQRLLAEAGFPGGRGFPTLGILYNTLDVHKKIADVIADQLRQNLGIDVRPYNQEWQSYMASVSSGQYDLARASWIGDYLDPSTFLDLWVTNGGNNRTGFGSPRYDALIRAAGDVMRFADAPERTLAQLARPEPIARLLRQRQSSADPAARRELLERARSLLLAEAEALLVREEFPVLPIYFYVNSGLRAAGLRGFHTELALPDGSRAPNLRGLHPLRDLWVEPAR